MDRAACRRRVVVERPVNRPKRYRHIATRCERRADAHKAFVTLPVVRFRL